MRECFGNYGFIEDCFSKCTLSWHCKMYVHSEKAGGCEEFGYGYEWNNEICKVCCEYFNGEECKKRTKEVKRMKKEELRKKEAVIEQPIEERQVEEKAEGKTKQQIKKTGRDGSLFAWIDGVLKEGIWESEYRKQVKDRYGRTLSLRWYTKMRKEMWGWEAECREEGKDRFWRWKEESLRNE